MDELSLVDPAWETIDPNPNIWSLFAEFDKRFFSGKLTSSCVELMWSSNRMTSTAGLCCWNPRTNYACIKLSQPLLQLRPRSDLVETLLHEMIHAFLFVTRQDDNHESHGPKFHMHMFRINKETGTNITVYHTFHDEVKHYQQHVWRCDGPCALRPPYYGYVRRANNRKPGPYDYWWASHQANCSGTFNKISEPEKVAKPKQNPKGKSIADVQKNKRIDDFFKSSPGLNNLPSTSVATPTKTPSKKTPNKPSPIKHGDIRNYISPIKSGSTFPGKGFRLGSNESNPVKRLKLEDIDTNERPSSAMVMPKESSQPLPDLISGIVNNISDDEDSFTYELPDIDLDDSIIIDSVISGKSDQISNKPTNPVQSNSTVAPKASAVKKKVEEDDEEDAFTYELPDFIPFFGTGFKLGSATPQPPAKGTAQKPQIISLD